MEKLEEKRRELIRKAASAQVVRDYEGIKYYTEEIEKINNTIYMNFIK